MSNPTQFTPLDQQTIQKLLPKSAHPIRVFLLSFLGMGMLFTIIGVAVFAYFFIFKELPSPYTLKDYKAIALSTHIFDRHGKLLYEVYGDQNRTPIKLKGMPTYISNATIAIEDKDFRKHSGVSLFSGVLRAVRDMIKTRSTQGGSTLTQQLVKNALLTPERTIQRKLKEIVLATWVEKIFSKDEILEMYLNQVPYGGSAYGIEEASKIYFNKHSKDLTIAEAAMLAGLPQAPSLYSPYTNPDGAISRRNVVLQKMQEQGFITKQQQIEAQNTIIDVNPPKVNIKAPHFVMQVKKVLENTYGTEAIEKGGYKITTTLDLDIQEETEKIVKEEVDKIRNLNVSNGAALVTRPPTGEVLAMVGSVDYFASPSGTFNVTTTENRQPGSTIKPINYAIGIDRKIVTAATVFLDIPTCFSAPGQPKGYCPVNYDGKFHGPTGLRYALANSYNIPAVKMLAYNRLEPFIASASAFGITTLKDPSKYGLSLTLGGGEIPMTEMAQAFSSFPNRGRAKKLNYVLKIEDKMGNTVETFEDPNFVQNVKKPIKSPNYFAMTGSKVISEDTAFIISHILQDNGARTGAFGATSGLVIPKKTVSVKTGTTDDKRDNWAIGYTPNFMVSTWVGNNDNSPMNQAIASGVTGATPIWNRIMILALKDQPDLPPVKTANVVGAQVCGDTGAVAGKNPDGTANCSTHFEYLIKGTDRIRIGGIFKETVPVTKDTDKLTAPNDPNMDMKEKTVIRDMFSTYCVDCNHDKDPYQTIVLR